MLAWLVAKISPPTPTDALASSPAVVEDWPKLRILVLGDSGVGKSCLVERLVTGKPPASTPRWTLGCDISVMVHTVVLNQTSEKKVLIELWDVGGHGNYAEAREVFYHRINGVILVHDSSNKKSLQHLKSWLEELEKEDWSRKRRGVAGIEEPRFAANYLNRTQASGPLSRRLAPSANNAPTDQGQTAGTRPLDGLPVLIVGNKSDSGRVVSTTQPLRALSMFDSVITSALAPCKDGRPIAEHEKFIAFFDKVYERRYGQS
jgi:small GTP-binding protein